MKHIDLEATYTIKDYVLPKFKQGEIFYYIDINDNEQIKQFKLERTMVSIDTYNGQDCEPVVHYKISKEKDIFIEEKFCFETREEAEKFLASALKIPLTYNQEMFYLNCQKDMVEKVNLEAISLSYSKNITDGAHIAIKHQDKTTSFTNLSAVREKKIEAFQKMINLIERKKF